MNQGTVDAITGANNRSLSQEKQILILQAKVARLERMLGLLGVELTKDDRDYIMDLHHNDGYSLQEGKNKVVSDKIEQMYEDAMEGIE